MREGKSFWLPTKPYNLVDSINRRAAATGSPRYAMASESADYNGHYITVSFNDYRQYWITQYYWAGRVVVARGSFADCLDAGVREYNRQGKGASLRVHAATEEQERLCVEKGLKEHTREIEEQYHKSWYTSLMSLADHALSLERTAGIPATSFLLEAGSEEEFHAKVNEVLSARRAARK